MNPKLKIIGVFLFGIIIGCGSIFLIFYLEYRDLSKDITKLDDSTKNYFIEMHLFSIAKNIEFYKLLNGRYPDNLSEVRRINYETEMYIDPYAQDRCIYEFYYHLDKTTNRYVLFSPGKDHKLFTEDDILPRINKNQLINLGLRTEKNSNVNYPDIECYEKDQV